MSTLIVAIAIAQLCTFVSVLVVAWFALRRADRVAFDAELAELLEVES